jgi:DNA-binding GntR family transcriptional regulator
MNDVTKPGLRLSDQAYYTLHRDIIRCNLRPGQEVTESYLVTRYQFGKAPIRAALLRLTQDNLVMPYPRRGYQIIPITLEYVTDIFGFRLIIEPEAVRLAVGRVEEAKLRALDNVCQAGYIPGDQESQEAFLTANRSFHVTLARASGNKRLAQSLEQALDEMERLFHLGLALRNRTDEMKHEHKALIDALTNGDTKEAVRLDIKQIEAARRMVQEAILSSSSLRTIGVTIG